MILKKEELYLKHFTIDNTDMKTLAYIANPGRVEDSLSEGGVYPVRAALAISVLALLAIALKLL